jgi:hypothetical protein
MAKAGAGGAYFKRYFMGLQTFENKILFSPP